LGRTKKGKAVFHHFLVAQAQTIYNCRHGVSQVRPERIGADGNRHLA
jgi:hypothetical protein